MSKKKIFRNFILCILVSILPVSCDIQKRIYRPGYFIQNKSSLPDRYFLPDRYLSKHIPSTYSKDSLVVSFDKKSIQANRGTKQFYTDKVSTNVQDNKVQTSAGKATELQPNEIKQKESNRIIPVNKEKDIISEPDKKKDYENLVLAFLAGAGFVLVISASRKGIKKYKTVVAGEKNKQEIANMADRLDRCADRFANAKNERIELAARNVSAAIGKCNDIEKAKKLEKSFHDVYLSPSQASDLQFITLNNLLSNDAGYGSGNGTLKPDVVTTTGGFYSNSAGSISWTMGEPISETVTDGNDTLTEGFQQGAYSIVSVSEVDAPDVNITVYPNPFTTTLKEMEDINPEFETTDVVFVVGANDVVNPAAKNNPASPIYGMPILEVERAKSIIVNKRSMNAGYAGIDNELFYNPKTSMLFGDAKKVITELVAELKSM